MTRFPIYSQIITLYGISLQEIPVKYQFLSHLGVFWSTQDSVLTDLLPQRSTRVSKSIYLLTKWHGGLVFIKRLSGVTDHLIESVLIFAETQVIHGNHLLTCDFESRNKTLIFGKMMRVLQQQYTF